MSIDLSTLNDRQIPAVLTTDGAVLVTAGAGSGKTRLLTHRIAYLIEEKGVKPWNILAITFTNKAANEMKERLENMIRGADDIWVSTFHSMCARILRRHADKLGYKTSFSIYGEQEKDNILKRIVKELSEDRNSRLYKAETKEIDKVRKRASYIISDAKNEALSPEEYISYLRYDDEAELLGEIYRRYETEMKKNNAFDFDDLLTKTYELLKNDAETREYYCGKFRYIHVDEFQDTNLVQYLLVKILAGKNGNVFVVGDEDQCIYGWRGAKADNMIDFTKDFECKVFKLEQNYRSTKKILGLANSVISHNAKRLEKTLWTAGGDGDDVTVFCARNETNEAEYVANVIKNLTESGEYSYSDFAVLMRVNALSRTFEERFLAYGIPHKMYRGFKFFERKEVKDLLAYLRVVTNGDDGEALLRIINFPKRGIGTSAIAQLVNYGAVTGQSLLSVVMGIEENADLPLSLCKKVAPLKTLLACMLAEKDKCCPSELVEYIVRILKLNEVYGEDTEENVSRKMNISALAESVRQFEKSNEGGTLEDYMQMISLYSDLDEMDEEDDCVALATIHSVKGLEFPVVFVIGCEDGMLPLSRSADSPDELEEERRLMYVAITRAMRKLYVTWAASRFMYNERKYTMPSRFLKEAGVAVGSAQPSAALARERAAGYLRDSYDDYGSGYSSGYGSGKSSSYNSYGGGSGSSYGGASVYSANSAPKPQKKDVSDFAVGTSVRHKKFGKGVILTLSAEAGGVYAEIEFEKFGKMMLSLQYAPIEIAD